MIVPGAVVVIHARQGIMPDFVAKEEGVELNDEQLESIAGGTWYDCMNETW